MADQTHRRQSQGGKLKGKIDKAMRRNNSEDDGSPKTKTDDEDEDDDVPIDRSRFQRESAPEPSSHEERNEWQNEQTNKKFAETLAGLAGTKLGAGAKRT